MGHMLHKYDSAYFLGGIDASTGRHYGIRGHAEFHQGRVPPELQREFEFTASVVGSLKGKSVLDIGFGRGDSVPLFLDAGASYTGIDYSQSAIDIASARYESADVRFFLEEAVDLSFQSAFDLIVAYDLVEHVPVYEMEIVWQKIHGALRPGGFFVLSTPIFDSPNAADHTELNPSVMGMHCNKQTLGTLARSCLRHGFTIASFEEPLFGVVRTRDLDFFDGTRKATFRAAHSRLLARCDVTNQTQSPDDDLEHRLVPKAGRVAIGCVAENAPKFLSQALRLVQSIRWFGGSMAGVNCFVCVVDECDPDYIREFERLGAFLRIVPRFDNRHGYSNKLRFLQLPELESFDTVMLMDCDTVVVQDPSPWLDGRVFQAKIADLPTLPHEIFEDLFRSFGLPVSPKSYRCNPGGDPTIWYCNAGVLAFPRSILPKLAPVWLEYDKALLERLQLLGPHTMFCDQASLALAQAAKQVPFRELPLEMNFPLHLTHLPPIKAMLESDPVILHYHDRIDASGYLRTSPYPGAQNRVEQFNERLHQERRRHFNSRLFWDFRYTHAPELGSGRGSRGEAAAYKQELLQKLVTTHHPHAILDIGCGDQIATEGLDDSLYTGIDVSSVIIERNRREHPARHYLSGDVIELDCPRSDMVLCLDVLIHLSDAERYYAMVRRVVELTGRVGLVAGYEAEPPIRHDITHYHEPLSESLRRAGARNLRKVGGYGHVTLWSFEPPGAVAAVQETRPGAAGLRQPVFVIGCMRSGTTLLAKLLDRIEGMVYCPFELKGIWSKVGRVPMASPKTRDTICPELTAKDIQPGQAERLSGAFLDEMAKYSANPEANGVFLSKNPHWCNKLPFVEALFPDARFIWIHRELPQVVASLKVLFHDVCDRQQTWHYWPPPRPGVTTRCWEAFHFRPPPADVDPDRCFPGGHVGYLAEYWLESNRAAAQFLEKLSADRFLIVRQEDLIERPQIEVARCLAFPGLSLPGLSWVAEEIDRSRNDLWSSRLTAKEHADLLEFVQGRRGDATLVLPGTDQADVSKTLETLQEAIPNTSPQALGAHATYTPGTTVKKSA